jgi:hypothetical protein
MVSFLYIIKSKNGQTSESKTDRFSLTGLAPTLVGTTASILAGTGPGSGNPSESPLGKGKKHEGGESISVFP